MAVTPSIFTDGILEASIHHGVARLVLGQIQADGKPAACGQVCIPLAQLPGVTQALTTLLRQVEAKLREAEARKAPDPEPPPLPGAFTFGDR